MRREIDMTNVDENAPLRLDIAARLAFPDGSIGKSGLSREAAKGRLVVWQIAGKQMTSLVEIRKMVERCRVTYEPTVSRPDRPKISAPKSGALSTAEKELALAAVQMRAKKLKESSRSTSDRKHPQ